MSCLSSRIWQEGPREQQARQSLLNPWEGSGAANPGNHFEAHLGEENHQKQTARLQGEVMFDQL